MKNENSLVKRAYLISVITLNIVSILFLFRIFGFSHISYNIVQIFLALTIVMLSLNIKTNIKEKGVITTAWIKMISFVLLFLLRWKSPSYNWGSFYMVETLFFISVVPVVVVIATNTKSLFDRIVFGVLPLSLLLPLRGFMEIFYGIAGVFFFSVFVAWILQILLNIKNLVKNTSLINENLKKAREEGFSYECKCNNTGFAINAKANIIRIFKDGMTFDYKKDDIRSIESAYCTAHTVKSETVYGGRDVVEVAGNAMAGSISSAASNLASTIKAKAQAFDASGIFISVADVNYPRHQIYIETEDDLYKLSEILKQFQEGTLPEK